MKVVLLTMEELECLQDILKTIRKEQIMKSWMVCSVWWLLCAQLVVFSKSNVIANIHTHTLMNSFAEIIYNYWLYLYKWYLRSVINIPNDKGVVQRVKTLIQIYLTMKKQEIMELNTQNWIMYNWDGKRRDLNVNMYVRSLTWEEV